MTLGPDDPLWLRIAELRQICARESGLLAHLYWPRREEHFEASHRVHAQGGPWRLKATSGHGVGKSSRPTLNFFGTDDTWVTAYEQAAKRRGIRHGLLVRRSAIEALASRPGFAFAEITPRYPNDGPGAKHEPWQFDIGSHRFKALDAMQFATVFRLATPDADAARYIDVPADAVVTVW